LESIPELLKSLKVVGKGCCLLCVGLFGGEAAIVLCTDLLWGLQLYYARRAFGGRLLYVLCIRTVKGGCRCVVCRVVGRTPW
jgi:hypothetical protein